MDKKELLQKTIAILQQLPAEEIKEVVQFAEFIRKKNDDKQLVAGIAALSAKSKSYTFPEEDENLYTLSDVRYPYTP